MNDSDGSHGCPKMTRESKQNKPDDLEPRLLRSRLVM